VVNNIFLGEYRHSIDNKSRVAVPNSYRKKLPPASEGMFVLQKGRDRTIEVHPLSDWREFWDRTLRKLPRYQSRALRLRRYCLAGATEVGLDSQGRILIPKRMLEEAGIKTEVVLAGAGKYFEIWEPGRYDAFIKEARENHDADLAELERHGWGLIPENDEPTGRGVSPSGPDR